MLSSWRRNMVPLVSFLAALRILTEAQSCNNGAGKLVYEKIADYKLGGSGSFGSGRPRNEVVTRVDLPVKVLEECVRRCAEDRTTAIQQCLSFDFVPGRRRSGNGNPNGLSGSSSNVGGGGAGGQYDESSCYFYFDKASPDGSDTLVRQSNAWHYNEICLTSPKISADCPARLYVFERTPGYKFDSEGDKEVFASNRTECEDKCLNEYEFTCRSATFDRAAQRCRLSRSTKSMKPEGLRSDPNCDYMENMCMPSSQMCTTTAFILESGKELDGAYERDVLTVRDFQECSTTCTKSLDEKGFLCRSFLFDDKSRTCVLYDEDPLGFAEGPETQRPLKPSSGDLYRVICGTTDRGKAPVVPDRGGGSYVGGYAWNGAQHGGSNPYRPTGWGNSGGGSGGGYGGSGYGVSGPPGGGGGGYGGSWSSSGYGGGYSGGYGSHIGGHSAGGGGYSSGGGYGPLAPGPWGSTYGSGYGGAYGGGYTGGPGHLPPYPPIKDHGPPFPPPIGGPLDRCKPGFGGIPPGAAFRKVGFGVRLRPFYVRMVVRAERLEECERACLENRQLTCRSFNFRAFFPDNCELSDQDTRQLQMGNPSHFEQNTQFDFYERDPGVTGRVAGDCLDVGQTCSPDGMEFTLKTPEGFFGRIYTYGFYDSCFFDGNGGKVNVLRISRANGFPRCGTQQYGDAMTNIVVVQFNDFVQTSRDKKYNLTCYFSGPGEAVVTSSYLDTRTDGRYPTQIEHLPAQNILTSNVVLRVLYRGTPTNTIAVGDLLTFRLEARGQYRFEFFSDIFATNVIAKDPYSGRQVHLIDSRGCPVDLYVFPELHRTPDGALEAEFYAFKIPDSNLLVFQATVRSCRGPCEPVICNDRGRPGTFPSWGRRRRSVNATNSVVGPTRTLSQMPRKLPPNVDSTAHTVTSSGGIVAIPGQRAKPVTNGQPVRAPASISQPSQAALTISTQSATQTVTTGGKPPKTRNGTKKNPGTNGTDDEEEEVHELLQVYLSRSDIPEEGPTKVFTPPTVCVAQAGYYALVTVVAILICLILGLGAAGFLYVRKTKRRLKESDASSTSPSTANLYVSQFQAPSRFDDPSEPIYTDPSLFERSKSMQALAAAANQAKTLNNLKHEFH